MSIGFTFSILDRASGPLRAIEQGIHRVQSALGRVGKATKLGGLGGYGGALGDAFKGLVPAAKKAAAGIGSAFSSVASGLAAPAAIAGAMGTAAVAMGGKYAADALMFKEDTLLAFKALTGSAEKASQVWDFAVKFAAKTPLSSKQVVQFEQSALVAGFRPEETPKILAGIGDIYSNMGQQGKEKAEQAMNAINHVMMTGALDGRSAMMLAMAGINEGTLYQNLAKGQGLDATGSLHQLRKRIQPLVDAGSIDARAAVAAALTTIADQFDAGRALGSAMNEKSEALSGLASSLFSRPDELLWGANSSSALAPLKDGIRELTALLDPASETGQRLVGVLEKAAGYVGDIFGGAQRGNGLFRTVTALTTAFGFLVEVGGEFSKGFGEGFGALMKPLVDLLVMTSGDKTEGVSKLGQGFRLLGQAVGAFVGLGVNAAVALGTVAGAIGYVGSVISASVAQFFSADAWSEFWGNLKSSWLGRAGSWLVDVGGSIVAGLWSGITQAWGFMLGEFHALVGLLPASVKQVLGIASPSKVFEGLGLYTVEGFEVGMRQGGGGLRAAANDTMGPSALVPKPAASLNAPEALRPAATDAMSATLFARPTVSIPELVGASSRTVSIGDISMPIHISGASDPEQTAAELEDRLRALFAKLFEELQLEAGARVAA